MKRKPIDVGLFDAEEHPLLYAPAQEDAPTRCDCKACLGTALNVVCERTGFYPDYPLRDTCGDFNHCTLDGKPARLIGGSSPYATIEPVDIDDEPICSKASASGNSANIREITRY